MSKFTFARPVPKKSAELDKNVDDAAGDLDGEGVSNLDEFLSGTDPNLADTDGDGLSDGTEGMEELRGDHRSQFLTINLVAIYLPLQRGSLRRIRVVTLSAHRGDPDHFVLSPKSFGIHKLWKPIYCSRVTIPESACLDWAIFQELI